MPLIEQQAVILHGWLSPEKFADIVTIAEMTPGPISLNAATFVGTQVAGTPGAIIASIGCVFPSTLIVFLLAFLYYRYKKLSAIEGLLSGVRPAVIALIASAGITLFCMAVYGTRDIAAVWKNPNYSCLAIIAIAVFILQKWKVKPLYIMFGSGLIYLAISLIK